MSSNLFESPQSPVTGFTFETTEFEFHAPDSDIYSQASSVSQRPRDYLAANNISVNDLNSIQVEQEDTEGNTPELENNGNSSLDENEITYEDSFNDSIDKITEIESSDRTDDSPAGMLNSEEEEDEEESLCSFPLGRIKSIMRADPEIQQVSARAVLLVGKATELFMECFGKELFTLASKQKKQVIDKSDIDLAICNNENLEFLDGALDWTTSED